MLERAFSVIFDQSKLDKYKNYTKIIFFIGILSIIAIPLLGEDNYIIEKQLKDAQVNSSIQKNQFIQLLKKYFGMTSDESLNDPIYKFTDEIFVQPSSIPYNKIHSKYFHSPRGEKIKFMMINLIYDQKLSNKGIIKRANSLIYVLIKYLSEYENIQWLAKDIQINYITSELFYDHPKEAYELLANGKYNKLISKGMVIESILNIDLNEFDVENIEQFLIKVNGVNSEYVDMDYFKMYTDTLRIYFRKNKQFTTNTPLLSEEIKGSFKLFFNQFGNFFSVLLKKKSYSKNMVYLIENILDNFFMIDNKINANHIFITKNLNSILVKIISNDDGIENEKAISLKYPTNQNLEESYFAIEKSLITYLKSVNTLEIDLFRGQYHFLYLYSNRFIGYNFLIVLILLTLRIFYELIDNIYIIEFIFISEHKEPSKTINGSKILSSLSLTSSIFITLFLHIEDIASYLKTENYILIYQLVIICCFIIELITLFLLNLTRHEERFLNNIFRFILTLNCYNFIFINEGIGLGFAVTVMPIEFILLTLNNRDRNFFKIFILAIFVSPFLTSKKLLHSMLENYIKFENNVYPLVVITTILIFYRIALIIVETVNKQKRGLNEDEDEEDNQYALPEEYIEEEIEDDKNEDDDKNEEDDKNEDDDEKEDDEKKKNK